MKEPNELQKAAMIAFCLNNAGEIKYVPKFNEAGRCTVEEIISRRLAALTADSAAPSVAEPAKCVCSIRFADNKERRACSIPCFAHAGESLTYCRECGHDRACHAAEVKP